MELLKMIKPFNKNDHLHLSKMYEKCLLKQVKYGLTFLNKH